MDGHRRIRRPRFFDGDYLLRAAGAMAGWGGNDKIEAFYLAMRIYWPEPEALDGTWKPPPVKRI
jgi:hypothetical protein